MDCNNININIFSMLSLLLLTSLPPSLSQLSRNSYDSICSQKLYKCGDKQLELYYPFWGGDRPAFCGDGSDQFKLTCEVAQPSSRDYTSIQMGSSQKFEVLDIDTTAYTMNMVPMAEGPDVCSPGFNFTLNPLFRYDQTVNNITVISDCPSGSVSLNNGNNFTCDGGTNRVVVYYVGEKDKVLKQYPRLHYCRRIMEMPAEAVEGHSNDAVTDLHEAWGKGFNVSYIVSEECMRCVRSKGASCRSNDTTHDEFTCYCPDGSSALHCFGHAPAPATVTVSATATATVIGSVFPTTTANATATANSTATAPVHAPAPATAPAPPPPHATVPAPPPPRARAFASAPAPAPAPAPHKTIAGHAHAWKWTAKLGLGITGVVIAGLLTICCFMCKSSSWEAKSCWLPTKGNQDIEAFLKNHGALTLKRYKFSDVKKMTNSFKIKLGQGGFGTVYKGKLLNGSNVAVKILKPSKGNGEDFINEVASISRTSHVNVVTLLGFCMEGSKKALIYEFMSNGSLDKLIYNKEHENTPSLSWDNLYQIAIGIARGLEYLHRGCNTRILHFDIKPHNILLDENFCPKISDFGLAKLCSRKESIISMSHFRGTIGYVAPEMFNRHFGGVSHKSDVYSYGMMLIDIVGGRNNVKAKSSHTTEYFPDWIYKTLEQGTHLGVDGEVTIEENEVIQRMTIVGLWCIQIIPNDRPTMSGVVEMLEGNMNSLGMPPKPVLSSPAVTSVVESSTTVC